MRYGEAYSSRRLLAPEGSAMRRRSLRLSPPAGASAAGVLCFWATLAAATASAQDRPAHRELTGTDAMSLRMPAVAERLGLSESQRRRVQRLIREHAAEFARLHRRYPRGEQD